MCATSRSGALAVDAAPSDVIRYDSSAGSYSICYSGAAFGLGPETNVDAVYMTGGDEGELFLSFDVPTDIGAFTGPTAVGGGVPLTSNVGGADDATGLTILTFDVPSDLAPPGITFSPGLIAQTDGLTYTTFEPLLGWPLTSEVDGVSCLANPGRISATLTIGKSTTTAGDLVITDCP
jgi:hypothetical protein